MIEVHAGQNSDMLPCLQLHQADGAAVRFCFSTGQGVGIRGHIRLAGEQLTHCRWHAQQLHSACADVLLAVNHDSLQQQQQQIVQHSTAQHSTAQQEDST
jgi:hypothetical protein